MKSMSQSISGIRFSPELVAEIGQYMDSVAELGESPTQGRVAKYSKDNRSYVMDGPGYIHESSPTAHELSEWMEKVRPDSSDFLLEKGPLRVVFNQYDVEAGWIDMTLGEGLYAHPPDVEALGHVLDQVRSIAAQHIPPEALTSTNRVFLGHGHGSDWKILRDALEKAGFDVIAFETVSHAGAVNIHAVDASMRGSFAAVLHMTPDDTMEGGQKRARQNVIHEIGFAQGALGVTSVVVVQHIETEMPSNLDGVTVVKYPPNGIYEKLEEVVRYVNGIRNMGPHGPYQV